MLGLCRYYASPRAAGAAHRILLRSAPPPIFTIAARIRVARAAGARDPLNAYDPSAQFSFRAPTLRAVPASGIPHTPVTGPALKAFARRPMITITSRPRAHANRETCTCATPDAHH